jgi:peptidoglycan/xylan/chitin deacetylase (PgdA/CDA1 family)
MTHENKVKYLSPFSALMSIQNLLKRLNSQIVFPFWHVVSDEELPHIAHLYKAPTSNEFIASLDELLKDFTPISLDDIVNQKLNSQKKYMCLSFDDGLVQMHDLVAPILKSKGIPAAFFVNPPFVGDTQYFHRYERSAILYYLSKSEKFSKSTQNDILNNKTSDELRMFCEKHEVNLPDIMKQQRIYMNLEEIKSLHESGFNIGAHSMTHTDFASIDTDEKIREVSESLNWISENISTKIRSFAFPFSDDGTSKSELVKIYKANDLHLSFGTSGHGKMLDLPHYQRIPMEHNRVYPTRKIIKSELFAAYLKQKIKAK